MNSSYVEKTIDFLVDGEGCESFWFRLLRVLIFVPAMLLLSVIFTVHGLFYIFMEVVNYLKGGKSNG